VTPLPGQVDPSRPHVVLPPQLQGLVDQLSGRAPQIQAPSTPSAQSPSAPSAPSAGQLLDFLLSP